MGHDRIFDVTSYINSRKKIIEGHLEIIKKFEEDIAYATAQGQPIENGPDPDYTYDETYFSRLYELAKQAEDTAPWFVWTKGGDISSRPLDCILFNTSFTRTTEEGFELATDRGMILARYVAAADPKAVLMLMDQLASACKDLEKKEDEIAILHAELDALKNPKNDEERY